MTDDEFIIECNLHHIDKNSYDLMGVSDERYILDKSHSNWRVYYSEKGLISGEKLFENRCEALSYLINVLKRDRTAQK